MKKKTIYFIIFALLLINLSGLLNYLFGNTSNPIIFLLCLLPGVFGDLLGWISTSILVSKLLSNKKDLSNWLSRPIEYQFFIGLPWAALYYFIIFIIW